MSNPLYPELPPGEFIRVLDLHPGSGDDELVGELRTTELGKTAYTALSYVCGNTALTHSIVVSGHKLGIYKNACELLTRFRDPTEVVTVWIDGICINQNDAKEKEREVAFMYKIYETAVVCNIWLGPGDEDSRIAIEYARTLDGDTFLLEYSRYLEFGAGSGHWERKVHVLDVLADHKEQRRLVNACAHFLLRPWFTRVWCTQEGAVSTNTVVYCGTDHVPWFNIFAIAWLFLPRWTISWPDWFMKDYDLLEPNLMNALTIQRYRLRRMNVENGAAFRPTSLLVSVLQSAAWRQKCFDPRDKIYAMRNIASDVSDIGDDWTPKPDYTISWRELYTNFAVTLSERGDKDVLRLSGTLRQGHDAALHSWAPDWRAFPRIQYLVHPEWCAGSKRDMRAKINRIPKKRRRRLLGLLPKCPSGSRTLMYTMSLPVVMRDEIMYLSDVAPGWKKHEDIKAVHHTVTTIDEANIKRVTSLDIRTYLTSEPLIDAYNKTLIANTTDEDTLASLSYVQDGVSAWRSWLKQGAELSEAPTFHEAIDNLDTFRDKRFCITKQGYFCMVPAMTQPTDIVSIIKGLEMPLLLRPVDTCYVYIGECYVHGMMEFQATNLIDEFSIKIRDGKSVWKPEGDVRKNGLSLDVGEYTSILETLGERWIELI